MYVLITFLLQRLWLGSLSLSQSFAPTTIALPTVVKEIFIRSTIRVDI
jgi:hypothetical protein